MPVVIVELWEGRTPEQKRRLVKAITDSMVREVGSHPEHLHVIIHDVPKDSWGRAGIMATELAPEGKGVGPTALPKEPVIRQMSHLLLFVEDLDRSLAFYTGTLKLQIRETMTTPDGRKMVALKQGLGLVSFPPGEVHGKRVEHIAFRCPGGIEPLLEDLKKAGVSFQGPSRSPYGSSIYFFDPDGNRIECHDSTGV